MSFFIHTDLGHDPDDAIALAFLCEHDYIPDELGLHPGYNDQIIIASKIYNQYCLLGNPPISCLKPNCDDTKYKHGKHSIFLQDKVYSYVKYPLIEKIKVDKALIIGPPLGLGDKLECEEMYFQGGYSPNSIHPLEKFKDKKEVQSFNPSGAKEDFIALLESNKIKKKYYIGKNVCHGFTKEKLKKIWKPSEKHSVYNTTNLVREFWDKLDDSKAMHDVLAAILCIRKDLGIWEQARPVFNGLKMTTEPTNEKIYTLIGLKDELFTDY